MKAMQILKIWGKYKAGQIKCQTPIPSLSAPIMEAQPAVMSYRLWNEGKGKVGRVEVVKCEWTELLRPPSALSYLLVLDISSGPQTKRKGEMSTRDRCLSVAPVHQTACVDNAGFSDLIRLLTAWLHWPILFALLFLGPQVLEPIFKMWSL